MKENTSYIVPVLFNGGGAVVNYVVVNGFASELVREIIANAMWSILALGIFMTSLSALSLHLTAEYKINGTIASMPIGFFGQTMFPLGALYLETFRYPNFGAQFIVAILTDYWVFHLMVGALIWIGVLRLCEII